MNKRRSGFNIAFRLITLVKPLMFKMIIAIIMGTLGYLTAIFITVFGAFAIVDVLNLETIISLKTIFISVSLFAVFRGILRYAEQAANHDIAFKILAIIRDEVFTKLRELAPAKLESKDKGNLISMITSDIELIEVFYAHTISPIAIAALVVIIMVSFLFNIHSYFSLIALLAYISVGIIIPMIISNLGKSDGVAFRNETGELSSSVLDSLRGLKEVIQYDYGDDILENITNKSNSLNATLAKTKYYEGLTTALSNTAIMVFSLITLFVSVYLFNINEITFVGATIAFVSMISSFGPTVALANLSNNLIQTFAAADRILDILDESAETLDIVDGVDVEFENIEISDLNFAYDDEVILKDFNLEVSKNEIVGIVGKSGSGKSTLLRLIMRFWDIDSGSLKISNEDIKNINTDNLRSFQSFVTQDTVIFNKSIFDNIRVAKVDATLDEVIVAAKKASIHDFILTLPNAYDTVVGELGDTLSGGERQRIGVARAFLHDAPLLLLDEPTSNLDSLNEGIILKSIYEAKENQTIILVSHRLKTLSIADRIIEINTERES